MKPEKKQAKEINTKTIFEEEKINKSKSKDVLFKAKLLEKQKIASGYKYLRSIDGKTFTLTKPKSK